MCMSLYAKNSNCMLVCCKNVKAAKDLWRNLQVHVHCTLNAPWNVTLHYIMWQLIITLTLCSAHTCMLCQAQKGRNTGLCTIRIWQNWFKWYGHYFPPQFCNKVWNLAWCIMYLFSEICKVFKVWTLWR